MWMSRYLIQRIAEEFKLTISFDPKLFADWNGSGCHTNFSTKTMREGTQGMKYIEDMMALFGKKHLLHMRLYGEDNQKRLTGLHETSSFSDFSYGCGNRGASFRIPTQTMHDKGKGYIEDRRPASNIDPYVVGAIMVDTACLPKTLAEPMIGQYDKWTAEIPSLNIQKV